jgi:hypothetical protein
MQSKQAVAGVLPLRFLRPLLLLPHALIVESGWHLVEFLQSTVLLLLIQCVAYCSH